MNASRGYDQSHEKFMRRYFHSLPEEHRHRYAVLEALKIGFVAIAYVARVLGWLTRERDQQFRCDASVLAWQKTAPNRAPLVQSS